jgi:hypothetical protein
MTIIMSISGGCQGQRADQPPADDRGSKRVQGSGFRVRMKCSVFSVQRSGKKRTAGVSHAENAENAEKKK